MSADAVLHEINVQMERVGVYVETLTPYEAAWVAGALADGLATQVGNHAHQMAPQQLAVTTYLYARVTKRCSQRALPAREQRTRTDLLEGIGQLMEQVAAAINTAGAAT